MINAILPLVCATVFFTLGAFVLFQKSQSKEKILFSLLCFEAFFWQAVWYASFFTADPNWLNLLAKIAYIAISFLPFTFYHFITLFISSSPSSTVISFIPSSFITFVFERCTLGLLAGRLSFSEFMPETRDLSLPNTSAIFIAQE